MGFDIAGTVNSGGTKPFQDQVAVSPATVGNAIRDCRIRYGFVLTGVSVDGIDALMHCFEKNMWVAYRPPQPMEWTWRAAESTRR